MFIFQIDEIEIKKDNLRNFVERWGEHPNSPYIFESNDDGSNFISPTRNEVLADSCLSSRGMLNNMNKKKITKNNYL